MTDTFKFISQNVKCADNNITNPNALRQTQLQTSTSNNHCRSKIAFTNVVRKFVWIWNCVVRKL